VERREGNMPVVKLVRGDGFLDYVFNRKREGYAELRVDYVDPVKGIRVYVTRFFVTCGEDGPVLRVKVNGRSGHG